MRQEHPLWSPGTRRSGLPEGALYGFLRCAQLRSREKRSHRLLAGRFRRMRNANSRMSAAARDRRRDGMSCRASMAALRKAPTTSSAGALKDAGAARVVPAQIPAKHQIAFTSGQSRARPSCKPSASWFLLAHGAENLPGLFRAPRASALEDLERQAMDRVGKSTPMSNGPAATPY
jgi:hypothetical protein